MISLDDVRKKESFRILPIPGSKYLKILFLTIFDQRFLFEHILDGLYLNVIPRSQISDMNCDLQLGSFIVIIIIV